ncbi:MAG: hypothetical protein ACKOB6_07030 [Candidatus Kapaibacterium sp.]
MTRTSPPVQRFLERIRLLSFATVLLLLYGAGFTSCNDLPNDVGSAVIPDTVNARSISSLDTTILLSSSTVLTRGVGFNAGVLYIGATPKVRAATVLRMTNIPIYLGTVALADIDSAFLVMRPLRFVYGDSSIQNNRLSFGVCELNKPIITADSSGSISASVRWPDLFTSGLTPNPAFLSSDTIASFSGQIPLKDTLSDLRMPLNEAGRRMIASWFMKQADSSKRSSIYGIGFVPAASSTVIRGFSTASLVNPTSPLVKIKVYYRNSSVRDSLELTSGNDCSVVDGDSVAAPLHLVQSIIQSEQRLSFDISSIPVTDAILKAQLTLTLDTTVTTFGNISTPNKLSIISRFGTDSTKPNLGAAYTSGKTAGSDKVIFSNVAQALDQARRSYGGKGSFSIVSNGTALERYAVYGLNASPALRPTLVITYAARPAAGGKR